MLKLGVLDISQIDKHYAAVIQLRTQPQGVVHQVVLRADKVKRTGRRATDALIRLGDTPHDEAAGWVHPQNIIVMAILGRAIESESAAVPWKCVPLEDEHGLAARAA